MGHVDNLLLLLQISLFHIAFFHIASNPIVHFAGGVYRSHGLYDPGRQYVFLLTYVLSVPVSVPVRMCMSSGGITLTLFVDDKRTAERHANSRIGVKAMAAKAQAVTYSADSIAFQASQTWHIPVTGKDVRGIARGDTGPALLARFAERNADGTNRVHQYTAAEAWSVLRALTARKGRRVQGLTAEPVAKVLGLAANAEAKATTSKPRKATSKATSKATVNRSLGERPVSVPPTE